MEGRSYYCGDVTEQHIGEKVILKGWVQRRRDLGGLIFIDLRDRAGVVQIVFNTAVSKEAFELAEKVRNEYVLEVRGEVVARSENTVNPNLKTGKIEIQAEQLVIINSAKNPPFMIENQTDVAEDVRLKYRYLDLRRPVMFETFKMRHAITKSVRNFLDEEGFIDVETPILTKSTPEGARDYLVPSRVHPGEFYALPQSPQLFKQLLMISGFDRYYQIARCFRDEDLRADRQPEFTQIDIETSFMSQEDILAMTERMIKRLMKEVKNIDIETPLQRLTYEEAMNRYGTDKPDTRFGMELVDLSETVKNSKFKVFASAVSAGGQVKAINAKGAAGKYSRKDIDALAEFAGRYGAKGLAWLKMEEEGLKGPVAKFFTEEEQAQIAAITEAKAGDLLLFVADKKSVVANALGALRNKLGKELDLIDESKFNFLWVTDWPLLEYDEEEGRYTAAHHPFTMPFREDIDKLETDPASVKAQAYDIVLNGYELGGGSLRIYERDVQEKMFKALGFSKEQAQAQFGFLLDAFDYGTPPHGGIALGLDRIVMLLAGRSNLRDTIAFPKTASASCLLTDAPGPVSDLQLDALQLELNLKK
ncbi:aspartate--tRNA(Asp/Asn) ligase [Weizmannia acidilactici]|uniref:Aspartate--tRNA ligase n=1 Tax=Weizmannia acidilactici TaxID=2607726 RepID=A0A5J4JFA4_9BACI|nr:aspartate--tRNA ligase [Weizmannia acidilactici]GER66233.1 aspartate--tRNA(Asp/Asn) ligase [Weizmannia acidilactici]GER69130.1 aspartate--tRNA(Asp/Asn) ligase [Weizmannia acidilactici]GER72173.1 aspartate--tRNA(Asp/Asn) ligase [Weizmannia acidilactici]